MKHGKPAHNIR